MRTILIVVAILIVLAAAGVAVAYRSEIDPVEPQAQSAFDRELVARGAKLAAVGNCITCHTSEGGEPYAGGYPVETPFGTIHGTNITPDPETGIGRWSEEAFVRAMREGIARDGHHLYPAFPYNHFTRTTDEDLRALYAFLMTRRPVRAETHANDLPFPFNFRILVAGWNLLFLEEGPYQGNPQRDPQWNRGAYLVEGLAHCGACHTPRNALGAPDTDHPFGGGHTQGWHAPALDASSPAPVPWDAEAVATYLSRGWHELHGAAAGPMAPVTVNLAGAPEEDVRAMATYIDSLAGEPSEARRKRAAEITAAVKDRGEAPPADGGKTAKGEGAGATLFAGACAVCHESGRDLDLALSTAVHAPDSHNLVRFVLDGVRPRYGAPGPFMPGYASVFTDEQVTALVAYVRERYSGQPAWDGLSDRVREARQGKR